MYVTCARSQVSAQTATLATSKCISIGQILWRRRTLSTNGHKTRFLVEKTRTQPVFVSCNANNQFPAPSPSNAAASRGGKRAGPLKRWLHYSSPLFSCALRLQRQYTCYWDECVACQCNVVLVVIVSANTRPHCVLGRLSADQTY